MKSFKQHIKSQLDESKMSELHMLIKQGKSAEQIAKIMKVDVKTIKVLMKESVELDEKIYDPMYYDAGMNNDANKDKFIKFMRKHRLTVITKGKTGTIEVFPKEGSDKQTIFKAAKLYGMIAVKKSVGR